MAKTSSWIPHVEAFVDSTRPSHEQTESFNAIASLVKNDMLTIESLVREMEMYLTTTDHVIRARGILLLAELLMHLTSKPLENATVHSLIGFFTERLADWKALHGALIGCLALLGRKSITGMVIGSDARAVAQSYLQNLQVQSLGKDDRKLCFELLECLLVHYPDAVATLGDNLVYGICEAIDGEKDPLCLLLTFHLVEVMARLFPDPFGPLASFAGDLFEILGCYFPIHFTHSKNDDFDVKRVDLSRALMFAFSSTPLFEPFAIPLLLEKLSSSLPLAKVDSLKYLSNCTLKYGADRMAKHTKAIWLSLKDTICTSSPQEPVFSFDSKSPDVLGFQENEIAKESLICLQKVILQNDSLFLNLIVEDEDIEMIMRSVTSCKSYNDIPLASKQKLYALGHILSVSAEVSTVSCNRIFQNFFPRLIDILGLSSRSLSASLNDSYVASERLNFGALYLCFELLAACRAMSVGFEELAPKSFSVQDTWCFLLQNSAGPLTGALRSTLLISMTQDTCEADIYYGVKGLQILATFPGCFLPISKSIFENILTFFMSIITAGFEKTLLWKLTLKALVQIGTFIEKFHDSEKAISYMNIVIQKIVSLISLDDSAMPFLLKLEAISDIGATGLDFMLRVNQGLEEVILANFLEASAKGNLESAKILVPLLECFSNTVLPWFHKTGGFEEVALQFAVNIWDQMENSMSFSIASEGKELLDATMMAMRLTVGGCSEENQSLIVQKAYSVLSSCTAFPSKESMPFPIPVKLQGLQPTQDFENFSCRDEWLISLFASVIIAVHPQTRLPNVRVTLKFFMTALLKGHVPAAQAFGSMINKLPVRINLDISSAYTLEEAINVIFQTSLWRVSSNGSLMKHNAMEGNDEGLTNLCLNDSNSSLVQTHAVVGLAWIGKGLLMRGHEKVRDITMILLRCFLSSSTMDSKAGGKYMDPVVMRSASDAFHVLLSDSEVCLNKRFHATIRPLYKQYFFSTTMPILLPLIMESDSSIARSMMYRAFGHIVSNTPLSAIVTEAKKLIPLLLDGLAMLSMDILDKDLTYSLLLVLSGILMDEYGQEAITENVHIIINRLTQIASYPHMMLVRETAIQCLVAVSGLPHVKIYPMRTQVLQTISKALDDPKRTVRQEAVRCRQAWASIASRSLHF